MDFPEKHRHVFNKVLDGIVSDARKMMLELWENWKNIGVDEEKRIANLQKLLGIEKDFHEDVVAETRERIAHLKEDIVKLQEETEVLSRSLSVSIPKFEKAEGMSLFEYKTELEKHIVEYREELAKRRMEIDRMLDWQQDLADKLGISFPEIEDDRLLSQQEMDKLRDMLEEWQKERDKRSEIFLNTQVAVKEILNKLQIQPQTSFEKKVVISLSTDFKVSDLNMERLAKLLQELQEKYDHTNNKVLELRETLTRLWDCLEEDEAYRASFLQTHTGCHWMTECALREEIERCERIKREKLGTFIGNIKIKIQDMWDKCLFTKEQRAECKPFTFQFASVDVLNLLEAYLEQMIDYYEENKQFLDMVAMHKELWAQICELEARASEPGRYNNRGGQLLKEEKERKSLAAKLTKLEAQLKEMTLKYEAESGKTFMIEGKPMIQYLEDQWDNRKQERQNKLSSRKQALLDKPTSMSLALSPQKRKAAMSCASASKIKRPLITSSATKAMPNNTNNLSALKRSALSTVKKRISTAFSRNVDTPKGIKRKLNYNEKSATKNHSILKHKRVSTGKRKSNSKRRSTDATASSVDTDAAETTTYTDFKNNLMNGKTVNRSSMATIEAEIPKARSVNVQKKLLTPSYTPKGYKENLCNIQEDFGQRDLMYTPKRLTRSATKLDKDNFATPRPPFSASKANQQGRTPVNCKDGKNGTQSPLTRAKTYSHITRAKVPPLII